MSEPGGASGRSPVQVHSSLQEPLSRWLWLVKWLLLIPHYIVLAFLWVAFVLVAVVAFFAILFTGRYPRGLFDFNLGVLRWSWRVSYYGYSALGTDRYPPFSLAAQRDYPATLDIAYPQRLSRGLVLVKWWLLAIPQYIVLGLLVGGTSYTVTSTVGNGTRTWTVATGSLLGILVLFAGVALLFTARYPRGLYDFAIGLNRWALRVVAYATLMTDEYPPFRLDQGGAEPAGPGGPPPLPPGGAAAAAAGSGVAPAAGASEGGRRGQGWSVVALVVGVLVALTGIGLSALGGGGFWLESRKDASGFVSTDTRLLSSGTPAISAEDIDLRLGAGTTAWVSSERFGTIRVRATDPTGGPIFIGIAPQAALDAWLAPVAHDEVTNIGAGTITYRHQGGTLTAPSPAQQTFWSASVSGTGTQDLRWQVRNGRWGLVLARPDGAAPVQARVDVGAQLPDLTGVAAGLLIGGLVLLVGGIVLVVVGAVGLGRATRPGPGDGVHPTPPAPPAPRGASEEESGQPKSVSGGPGQS